MAMKSTALLQRLGFLTDLVGRKLSDGLRLQVRNAIPKIKTLNLRPARPQGRRYRLRRDWGLFVYARRNDLLAEVPRSRRERGAMLTANQTSSGCGPLRCERHWQRRIDVILTYLLQLFAEKGIMDHVGFKGGTMLRKMVFGPRGRLFHRFSIHMPRDITADDLMLMMLDALNRPYHGISFRFDREKDWYLTDDGCAANPVCAHAENERGVKSNCRSACANGPFFPFVRCRR